MVGKGDGAADDDTVIVAIVDHKLDVTGGCIRRLRGVVVGDSTQHFFIIGEGVCSCELQHTGTRVVNGRYTGISYGGGQHFCSSVRQIGYRDCGRRHISRITVEQVQIRIIDNGYGATVFGKGGGKPAAGAA